jgi:ribose transport system substrate-binding protein
MSQSPRLLIAGAALAATALLAGCSSGGSASSTDGSGGSEGAGQKLAMVGLYAAPYTDGVADGAKAAADLDSAEFTQYGPVTLDPNKAISDFQNAVAAGATGVLVQAFPGDLWVAPIKKATGVGVTVATSDVPSVGSGALTNVGPQKVAMGAALADEYIKQLPDDASGIIVPGICVAGLRSLTAPIEGFATRIEEERPGIDVIEAEVTAGDPPSNFAAWQRIQAKYPDALGFVGACDQDLTNMVKMKQQAGGDFLIGVTAGGDDPVAAKSIAGGEMVGAVTQRPWLQGYVGMRLIANTAFRDAAQPEGWINTGFDIVTPDNAEEIASLLEDPAVAQDIFEALGDQLVDDADSLASEHPVEFLTESDGIDTENPMP